MEKEEEEDGVGGRGGEGCRKQESEEDLSIIHIGVY